MTNPGIATVAPAHLHPAYLTEARQLRVRRTEMLAPAIMHIELVDPHGGRLAGYQPGSHLIVSAGDKRNAYSLVGSGLNPDHYAISVMRRGEGGGSDWLHDNVCEGHLLEIEGPRALFAPVLNQHRALLIAGGIGVTPVLSHARAAALTGVPTEVLYSYRPGHQAHLDDLRGMAECDMITLHEATTVEQTVAILAELLAKQPLGTHAYACGPVGLLQAYQHLTAAAGWPAARVHLERFSAPVQDPGKPFSVTVTSTGQRIEVPAGVSLLQRLLDNGVEVPFLCRRGVCGECRIPVRSGVVEHRDYILTDEEKAESTAMLCCVSRGYDIEVDL
ncbi:PDR/VanB family oxidoreductase [Mycobacterium shigaense]|uniref:PDR/VanB family oxidoreductase n=1 Tax=Mycobacterium shigaense TaxID=722731 RepID=UPI000E5811FF|nr:PDR/VanB family oxidoreductase [Mycobacterium shigaense]